MFIKSQQLCKCFGWLFCISRSSSNTTTPAVPAAPATPMPNPPTLVVHQSLEPSSNSVLVSHSKESSPMCLTPGSISAFPTPPPYLPSRSSSPIPPNVALTENADDCRIKRL